jgi:U3 small nucleolar RNA-associated protein 3
MLEAARKKDRAWEERIRVEEELMTRMPMTRKDKKTLRQQTKFANELTDLADFGDYSLLKHLGTIDEAGGDVHDDEAVRKQSLRSVIGKSVGGPEPVRAVKGGDDDVPAREKRRQRESTLGEDYNTHMDSDNDAKMNEPVSEDEYYEDVKQSTENRRSAKEESFHARFEPAFEDGSDNETGGDKRAISREIMKNKGLTPNRPKDRQNPRKRRRNQYEKSMKKLKSIKATVKQPSGNYGGEQTGIKKNLARSVKY